VKAPRLVTALGSRLPAGVRFAIGSAVLFGLSTPCAKALVGGTPPLLLAGLLYVGSFVGLTGVRLSMRRSLRESPLSRGDLPWLAGAVVTGGVLGPVLLLWGLRAATASTASLLLNLEGVFTALLAWVVFHENVDRRIAVGFALIVAGGVVLSWTGPAAGPSSSSLGTLAIAAACLCWAIDNNLTQRISWADPLRVAAVKGAVAGSANLALATAAGAQWPSAGTAVGALAVGFAGYGVSLSLYVLALRHLGTARTGAYFALAPFLGAAASLVLLREPADQRLVAAFGLMAAGVWLHLTETHEHSHSHDRLEHAHSHVHDEHHEHDHVAGAREGEPHTHVHVHEGVTHRHRHYPDVHHRHRHP
jgi:drug/metabolite transporter (DMT)-like permease